MSEGGREGGREGEREGEREIGRDHRLVISSSFLCSVTLSMRTNMTY